MNELTEKIYKKSVVIGQLGYSDSKKNPKLGFGKKSGYVKALVTIHGIS